MVPRDARTPSLRGSRLNTPSTSRRATTPSDIGGVPVGAPHPIVVQSMTNTDTADVDATARQVRELHEAGSEIVRITVNTPRAAAAVPRIAERLADRGVDVPLVGDFHFNGHILLPGHPGCARALAKFRINPGNVGRKPPGPAVRDDRPLRDRA